VFHDCAVRAEEQICSCFTEEEYCVLTTLLEKLGEILTDENRSGGENSASHRKE